MKIEVRVHYWPKTPELREIKLRVDGEEIYSTFINQNEMWDLAEQFRYIDLQLMEIANKMDY